MPLIFDVYGTLLDVDSAARAAAAETGMDRLADKWPELAAKWRTRQLSYSWLRTTMQNYADFWTITENALDTTLSEMGLEDPALREKLLSLYVRLSAYEDANTVLDQLLDRGERMGVLSNGSPDMLHKALTASGLLSKFEHVISVDSLKRFKPDPAVYKLATDAFGCAPSHITFFSSNYWDVSGAGNFGFKTIWVNRFNQIWEDLPSPPNHQVKNLSEALAVL